MKITGNEPAVPITVEYDKTDDLGNWQKAKHDFKGLTIRQQFAAMAMQGLSSNANLHTKDSVWIAAESVRQADDLIRELNKKEEENV